MRGETKIGTNLPLPLLKCIDSPWCSLAVLLAVILSGQLEAQTITNIFNSDNLRSGQTNVYGAGFYGDMILSGNTLYGATDFGGTNGLGIIYSCTTNGTYAVLHPFAGVPPGQSTNSDGFSSTASLLLTGNVLYGTAKNGGPYGNGTLFSLNTVNSNFTVLHSFAASTITNGAQPGGGVILSGNTLYGTTTLGGTNGSGVIYAINTNGTGFVILRSLSGPTDGGEPASSLILSGNTLYGSAEFAGTYSAGTLFSMNTNGSAYTILHKFDNTNGQYPNGLVLYGGTLYGTTQTDKTNSSGVIFSISTNGNGFTVLHYFTGNNNDGGTPNAGLAVADNMLFGTTYVGAGPNNYGNIFAINTNGTGYAELHVFQGPFAVFPADGGGPQTAPVVAPGNTFYGTAGGGSGFAGVIYSLVVPTPQLNLAANSKTNVLLTWPTNASSFFLQASTNLIPPAVWNTVSPLPVIVNGKNTVTNPASGKQLFYRLAL